jgi:hypothetical protein
VDLLNPSHWSLSSWLPGRSRTLETQWSLIMELQLPNPGYESLSHRVTFISGELERMLIVLSFSF